MEKNLPTNIVEALRTLARVITEAADAGTLEAFKNVENNKDAHAALDTITNFSEQ